MKPDRTADLFDAMPPADLEAERQVIGSIIIDPRKCDDVADVLHAADFYDERHETLYAALLKMRNERRRIDPSLLAGVLKAAGKWDSIGGAAYLAEIIHGTPVAAHALDYAEMVAEKAKRRRLRNVALAALRNAHDSLLPVADSIVTAEAGLAKIETGLGDGIPTPIAVACKTALDRVEETMRRKSAAGVLTGFWDFDRNIGGLFPGELIVLSARPGVGKTSLACQWAKNVAAHGKAVYFASLEMDACELATRMLCEDGEINSRRLRNGEVSDDDLSELVKACNRMASAPLVIHDRPRMSVRDMTRAATRMHANGLGLVVVDYMQRIAPEDRRLDRYQQVAEMAKGLKTLARELCVPVVCLAQQGRPKVGRKGGPELDDLRESGDIEAEADVVAFLETNVAWSKEEPAEEHRAALTVKKNRNGPKGRIRLWWDAKLTRFSCPEQPQREEAFDAFSGEQTFGG